MLDHNVSAVGPKNIVLAKIPLIVCRDDRAAFDRHDRVAIPNGDIHAAVSVIAVVLCDIIIHTAMHGVDIRKPKGLLFRCFFRADGDNLCRRLIYDGFHKHSCGFRAFIICNAIGQKRVAVRAFPAHLFGADLHRVIVDRLRFKGNDICCNGNVLLHRRRLRANEDTAWDHLHLFL